MAPVDENPDPWMSDSISQQRSHLHGGEVIQRSVLAIHDRVGTSVFKETDDYNLAK